MPKTSKASKSGARNQNNPPTKKEDQTTLCGWAKDGDIFIAVHAKPGARQSCITDISDSQVSIQIAAPAQEGEANSELLRALASIISVRKSSISIDHGHRSREKRVRLADCDKYVSIVLEILKSNVGNYDT